MIFRSTAPDIEIPSASVYQYVTRNLNGIDDNKPVFIDAVTGAALTFGAFKRDSRRVAAGLQDKFGLKKGDVVAIFSPNQVKYIQHRRIISKLKVRWTYALNVCL